MLIYYPTTSFMSPVSHCTYLHQVSIIASKSLTITDTTTLSFTNQYRHCEHFTTSNIPHTNDMQEQNY
jgi:hypothetical protein